MSHIRPDKNRWMYYYYWNGKLRNRSLGIRCRDRRGNLVNRKLAEKLQAELDYDLQQPAFDPAQWRRRPARLLTVGEFFDEYLKHIRQQVNRYKIKTTEHYEFTFRLFRGFMLRDRPLAHIDRRFIDREYLPWLYENYTWNTARGCLIDLRSAFNVAVKWGYLESNPFAGVNTRRKKTVPRFYTREEIEIMREYFSRPAIPPWQGDMVFLCLNTGLRREEVVSLTWRQVFPDLRAIILPGKGDKERVIPLFPEAMGIILRRPRSEESERVFWEIRNYEAFRAAFERMRQRTGLGGNIHQLRKTFASHWAMQGKNPYRLKEILGHESLSTTLIYYALSPESLHGHAEEDFRGFPARLQAGA